MDQIPMPELGAYTPDPDAEPKPEKELEPRVQKAIECSKKGEVVEAEKLLISVLDEDPKDTEALHLLALIAASDRRIENAIELMHQAFELDSTNAKYAIGLARICAGEELESQAMAWYLKAIEINPKLLAAYLQLGTLLAKFRCWSPMVTLMARAVSVDETNLQVKNFLGTALMQIGELDKAVAVFQMALEQKSDDVGTLTSLCEALKTMGKIDEAKNILEAACTIHPEAAEPLIALADLSSYELGDPVFEKLEKTWTNRKISKEARSAICFSLADLYRKAKDYENSFKYYAEGNMLRASWQPDWDIQVFQKRLAEMEKTFTREYFAQSADFGLQTTKPIFIVGLARSGTSLVEQILASHPRVFGAGELSAIGDQVKSNLRKDTITREAVEVSAKAYLSFIEGLAGKADYVTDKLPYNILHMWAIQLMFPQAAIIYCRRDPMDNCFSCYVQNFMVGHQFTNDLETIGTFYRYYEQMMEHWKKATSLRILEVQYEDMVENPRENMGRILEFCGLEWDEQVERFYETDRPVRTASRLQVKQKIYKTSVKRYKPYEQYLGALADALEKHKGTPLSKPIEVEESDITIE